MTSGFHGRPRPARPVVREMHDEDFALVYYNYRYYNPRDGRWINRDPIAEKGGWNLYAFLGNSTQDKFDTFGLQALDSLSNTVIQGLAAGKISEVATLLGYSTTAALVAALIEGGYKLKCKACIHLWDLNGSNVTETIHTTAGILIIIFLQLISLP